MPKRNGMKKEDLLEATAQYKLPPLIHDRLSKIHEIINELKQEAKAYDVDREFTPDGRFLGDLGELIAKIFFGVVLTIKQEKGHDATHAEVDAETKIKSRHKVEIKLSSKSTLIWFSTPTKPDIILVIYVSPKSLKWGVVCNGPGEKLLADAKWDSSKNRYVTNCYKLMKAQEALSPDDLRLEQLRT